MELLLDTRQMSETAGRVSPKNTMMLGHFSFWIHFKLENVAVPGEMEK